MSRALITAIAALAVTLTVCGSGSDSGNITTTTTTTTTTSITNVSRPILPDVVIAGYTNQAAASQILDVVAAGANVLFWSFMELQGNEVTIEGLKQGSVTAEKVRPVYEGLKAANRTDVLHILSIGGWGVEHHFSGSCGAQPCSGVAYADSFRSWNEEIMSQIPGFPGFAGMDWDIEGVDEHAAPSQNFTEDEYQIILDMSQSLREDFLVTMVPPQSYFNCHASHFDTSLEHPAESTPDFTYAALNAYTVLFAKCPECFDLVMVQVYEGYSLAGFELYWGGDASHIGTDGWPRNGTHKDMVDIISANMKCLMDGFTVDFNGFMGLGIESIVVPAEKVVIGLGNGWTTAVKNPFKFPFFEPSAASEAWCGLGSVRTRGFMYWDIKYDTPGDSFAAALSTGMSACSSAFLVA